MADKPLTERVLELADELIGELEHEHHCDVVPDYRSAWERLAAEHLKGPSPASIHPYVHGDDALEAESCRRMQYAICQRRIDRAAVPT